MVKLKIVQLKLKNLNSIVNKYFEPAALAGGWTEEDKATELVLGLHGDALEILNTLTGSEQQSYRSLVEHLDMQYVDQHLQLVYQVQINIRKQMPGQMLKQFEIDVFRLVGLAYPTARKELLDTSTV